MDDRTGAGKPDVYSLLKIEEMCMQTGEVVTGSRKHRQQSDRGLMKSQYRNMGGPGGVPGAITACEQSVHLSKKLGSGIGTVRIKAGPSPQGPETEVRGGRRLQIGGLIFNRNKLKLSRHL